MNRKEEKQILSANNQMRCDQGLHSKPAALALRFDGMEAFPANAKPEPIACEDCGLMVEPVFVGTEEFGRWVLYNCCPDCKRIKDLKATEIARIKKQSQNRREWAVKVKSKLTSNIEPLYASARLQHIAPRLREVISSPDSSLLWGGCGSGKTYAAIAQLRQEAIKGHSVSFVLFDDLLADIRKFKKTEDDVLEKYLVSYLLVLDDVGQSNSDFAIRILFRIVNKRLSNMKKTIITTNLSPENLSQAIGERIYSRLKTYRIVQLTAKDRRESK